MKRKLKRKRNKIMMELMKYQIFRFTDNLLAFAMVTNESLYVGVQRLEKLLYNTSEFFQPT